MVLSKGITETDQITNKKLNSTEKRRIRRNRLRAARTTLQSNLVNKTNNTTDKHKETVKHFDACTVQSDFIEKELSMSANENKPRDDVLAARQAKKLAKQKGKDTVPKEQPTNETTIDKTNAVKVTKVETPGNTSQKETILSVISTKDVEGTPVTGQKQRTSLSKDEVDKAVMKAETAGVGEASKELVKAERAAKKAAKQAKKKGADVPLLVETAAIDVPSTKHSEDMTVKDVVETLRDIVNVAKEIKDVTVKVNAMDLGGKKSEESNKSKAELKAERRAKQEAQRAAKQAANEQATAKPKLEAKLKPAGDGAKVKEASPAPKQKPAEKTKPKSGVRRVNWFQHLYTEHDKEALKSIAINSNLHPAIVKLGVQLATRVVTGSNARCVALLDALKKMVRDYTLPAKTEFGRGLESHLAKSLEYLWAMQPPSATQTNAVKFFRYHLTQLPNNVDEFDAKKTLQEEIDRYIREQIDMAGEAISIAVRNKISHGDVILTYGCSSLIERIFRDAWSAGVQFRAVVAGERVHGAAAEMLRRLVAHGLPCTYVDITALGFIMKTVGKVVLGADSLLGNGAVVGAAGSAQAALAARACNVPVLVAAETHKFTDRVQTDAILYNGIGDPDDLIDKSDENSPLKDWRSNPNLTPLNLTYDVTPPSLVTAVVTELAILPCTSAPVVLRFKLSEYGIQG